MKTSVIFSILFFTTSLFSQDYNCRIKTIFPLPVGNFSSEGKWEGWSRDGDVYSMNGTGKYLIMYEDQNRIRLARSTGRPEIMTVIINKKKLEMTQTLTSDGFVMVAEGKCELSE